MKDNSGVRWIYYVVMLGLTHSLTVLFTGLYIMTV